MRPWSPILINVRGAIKLSNLADGVLFDLLDTGTPRLVPWPVTADNAWLVMDRNGNGVVDSGAELFGTATDLTSGIKAPHGFAALKELDANGDGFVDESDPSFDSIRVWTDSVRDGRSAADELFTLPAFGIEALSVEYQTARRSDRWGNLFRWRAHVYMASGSRRYAYDVILNVTGAPQLAAVSGCSVIRRDSEFRWSDSPE
jgi:hypothetical protein